MQHLVFKGAPHTNNTKIHKTHCSLIPMAPHTAPHDITSQALEIISMWYIYRRMPIICYMTVRLVNNVAQFKTEPDPIWTFAKNSVDSQP